MKALLFKYTPRSSRAFRFVVLSAIFTLGLCLFTGCEESASIPRGSYYLNPDKPLTATGRVALLELSNRSKDHDISHDMTQTLFKSIQTKQLFSLTLLDCDHPVMQMLGTNLDASYTLKQLADIQETCKCQAVLMGSVIQYRPYPHLTLAMRLKLIDLSDGQLIWAMEQVWDSSDTETQKRIHSYAKKQLTSDAPSLQEHMITVSPLAFMRFAAHETAQTLSPGN